MSNSVSGLRKCLDVSLACAKCYVFSKTRTNTSFRGKSKDMDLRDEDSGSELGLP